MRLAIVQQLPLEYYPPVTNLLTCLAEAGDFEIRVFTVENTRSRPRWEKPGVRVSRTASPLPGERAAKRLLRYAQFLGMTLAGLIRFRPKAILYFEPHSALPVCLYRRWFSRRVRVFIHHHEYYDPGHFHRPGMRLPRLAHRCERRFLFARADWVSQTNEARRSLFLADHPELERSRVRILPNYPPASWRATKNLVWQTSETDSPLRFVYVGSLSLRDTYLAEFVGWLEKQESGKVMFDVFAYNLDDETAAFLDLADPGILRFHRDGVEYDSLPEILSEAHIGMLLYRAKTTNYRFNASNKLFEYLACGLDVIYPDKMLGVRPHRQEGTFPRLLEVDFEAIDMPEPARLASRTGLSLRLPDPDAESAFQDLESELRRAVTD